MDIEKEHHFHNQRVLSEGDSGRLSYVYASLGENLNFPASQIRSGMRVLEIGCFVGDNCCSLDEQVEYVGIDISTEAIRAARERYQSADHLTFLEMDAHELESIEGEFDYIFGNGVLHHLDLSIVMPKIRDKLCREGMARFMEPMEGPPWLRIFRRLTPSIRTDDEHPLTESDLEAFKTLFKVSEQRFGLVSPIFPMLFLNANWAIRIFNKVDHELSKFSPLKRMFWLNNIELCK